MERVAADLRFLVAVANDATVVDGSERLGFQAAAPEGGDGCGDWWGVVGIGNDGGGAADTTEGFSPRVVWVLVNGFVVFLVVKKKDVTVLSLGTG